MNKLEESVFGGKKLIKEKLTAYGFIVCGEEYLYRTEICEGQMLLTVKIFENEKVEASVFDAETEESYTLFAVEGAVGEFVGRVRAEYFSVLEDIAVKCYESKAFESGQSDKILNYAREKYGDEPEFLWDDLPKTAIWRRKDSKKWYAVLMTVPRKKLGLEGEGNVEIIDVRIEPAELDKIADGKKFFRGYHMNKKHWLTFCLDGAISNDEIFAFIDKSYLLAKK